MITEGMPAAWAATVAIGASAVLLLLAGVTAAVRQVMFLRASYRVDGRVVSEWRYRVNGSNMRHYRVRFSLLNGQSAELRSSVSRSADKPRVGETVPVRVREAGGKVNARIGTWVELWFSTIVLLSTGGLGSLITFAIAWAWRPANAF